MTTDNDFDKPGSGFNLDEGEDLASMLGRAERASEDDGDLNVLPERTAQPTAPQPPAPLEWSDPTPEPAEEEPVTEPDIPQPLDMELDLDFDLPAEHHDEAPEGAAVEFEPQVDPEPEPEPEAQPEPEPTPEPVAPAPTSVSMAPPQRGRVHVPSEAEQVSSVARTVAILDAYRALSAEEKAVTVQFVTTGQLDSADDATVVVKVLNADPMLVTTMRSLREAYECDPVARAFYAMGLDTKTLHSLGSLVSVFSDKDYDETLTNLDYSRRVVEDIAQLGDREIGFVKATESVLAAAESVGR